MEQNFKMEQEGKQKPVDIQLNEQEKASVEKNRKMYVAKIMQ